MEVVSSGKALSAGAQGAPELPEGPTVEEQMQERLSEHAALKAQMEAEALSSLKIPKVKTKKAEVMTKHLGDEAQKDPVAMAQLVRTWLHEEAD